MESENKSLVSRLKTAGLVSCLVLTSYATGGCVTEGFGIDASPTYVHPVYVPVPVPVNRPKPYIRHYNPPRHNEIRINIQRPQRQYSAPRPRPQMQRPQMQRPQMQRPQMQRPQRQYSAPRPRPQMQRPRR